MAYSMLEPLKHTAAQERTPVARLDDISTCQPLGRKTELMLTAGKRGYRRSEATLQMSGNATDLRAQPGMAVPQTFSAAC